LGKRGKLSAGYGRRGVAACAIQSREPAWRRHRLAGSSQIPQRCSLKGWLALHLGIWQRGPSRYVQLFLGQKAPCNPSNKELPVLSAMIRCAVHAQRVLWNCVAVGICRECFARWLCSSPDILAERVAWQGQQAVAEESKDILLPVAFWLQSHGVKHSSSTRLHSKPAVGC